MASRSDGTPSFLQAALGWEGRQLSTPLELSCWERSGEEGEDLQLWRQRKMILCPQSQGVSTAGRVQGGCSMPKRGSWGEVEPSQEPQWQEVTASSGSPALSPTLAFSALAIYPGASHTFHVCLGESNCSYFLQVPAGPWAPMPLRYPYFQPLCDCLRRSIYLSRCLGRGEYCWCVGKPCTEASPTPCRPTDNTPPFRDENVNRPSLPGVLQSSAHPDHDSTRIP